MAIRSAVPCILALSASLAWQGCGSTESSDQESGFELPDSLDGVNLAALFAPATDSEIHAVQSDWQSRAVQMDSAWFAAEDTLSLLTGEKVRLELVAYQVAGSTRFGLVTLPLDTVKWNRVLLQCHGGDDGVSSSFVSSMLALAHQLVNGYVNVFPAFPAEPAGWTSGSDRLSGGNASPWDYDVDDAFAMLEAVWALHPGLRQDSYDAVGYSRGGGVALLAAIRDPRIDKVVDFFGPTDFLGPFLQEQFVNSLRGDLSDLPGADFLDSAVVLALQKGNIDPENARMELVRRSPILFVEHLPKVQIHHGDADSTVPVDQSRALWQAMVSKGDTTGSEYREYADGEHNPLTLDGAIAAAQEFLLGHEVAMARSGVPLLSAADSAWILSGTR